MSFALPTELRAHAIKFSTLPSPNNLGDANPFTDPKYGQTKSLIKLNNFFLVTCT
jgi:hypothetical protein